MNANRLLILTLAIAFLLGLGQLGFSQISGPDYDFDGTTDLEIEAGTTIIHDLDVIKERAIQNILRRIRRGDDQVLRFVVYDVLEEVHREVLEEIEESEVNGRVTTDYYAVLGNEAALDAFIGGFDNQDPKVRLRCIGFLGDWVDDIGKQLEKIGKAANDRLTSAIETREEVKYGLMLLQLKVLRKRDLNAIYNGDENMLQTIRPEEFMVLVHSEDFIRRVFCIHPEVILRSIRLNPWWIDDYGVFVTMRDSADEEEKVTSRQRWASIDYFPEYVKKLDRGSVYRNYPEDASLENRYGYKDRAGNLDIISLYDQRYFRYQGNPEEERFFNEEKYIPAIFMGLANPSLFVRENCARIIVRLTDGPIPDPTDENVNRQTMLTGDETIISEKPWEIKDANGQVVGVNGMLGQMANNQRYRNVAKVAWENVKFAQFVDVHQYVDPINPSRKLDPTDGTVTIRDIPPEGRGTNHTNPWGYTYNYRTDVADIMRRIGLGNLVNTCDIDREPEVTRAESHRRYFVEDLMDLDGLDLDDDRYQRVIPAWHGQDVIRDEIFDH
jgi:hypothetical protein